MTRDESIIELGAWLRTAPGQYLLAWEQDRLDHGVADAFGFHALQLGLPELPVADGLSTVSAQGDRVHVHCEFDALPFPGASLDLVVLPHALELARDPHLTLREVERVLVPEGRVLIAGFNPASLWGLRQRIGHLHQRSGLPPAPRLFLPRAGEFIGYWRLRDWLRLLGFEVEAGHFGCWRPPCQSERWLERYAWMDRAGDRWWPVLGAVYVIEAVKRVRGMRLVGLAKRDLRRRRQAGAVVAQRRKAPEVEQG